MKRWLTITAILLAATALAWREYSLLPDGNVHLHVLDVGQGDGLLLISPSGKQIVIDGGPDLSLLEHLGKHLPFFDRTIELLVLTHPDADHITALPEVLRRYTVDAVLMTGAQHGSSRYDAFLAAITDSGTQVIIADPARDIDLRDGLRLDIIWPTERLFGQEVENANNPSVVLKAIFGDQSILLAGDIEESAEREILASGADVRADVLKVPHHGSRTSSSTGFLLAVDPDLALISAGRNNPFGHPHEDVLKRYERLGIPVRSTTKEGEMEIVISYTSQFP